MKTKHTDLLICMWVGEEQDLSVEGQKTTESTLSFQHKVLKTQLRSSDLAASPSAHCAILTSCLSSKAKFLGLK